LPINVPFDAIESEMLTAFLNKLETQLKEENTFSMFENAVLRGIFGLKGEEVKGQNCIMRFFIICTPHQLLLGLSNQRGLDG
jgi:hypothetical protein